VDAGTPLSLELHLPQGVELVVAHIEDHPAATFFFSPKPVVEALHLDPFLPGDRLAE
jgi:hypothetical protein